MIGYDYPKKPNLSVHYITAEDSCVNKSADRKKPDPAGRKDLTESLRMPRASALSSESGRSGLYKGSFIGKYQTCQLLQACISVS
jgi:hypothetical protein